MISKKIRLLIVYIAAAFLVGCGYSHSQTNENTVSVTEEFDSSTVAAKEDVADSNAGDADASDEIPTFSGEPYAVINDNVPFFTSDEKRRMDAFEEYSDLDQLGRCGVAFANICVELMPTEERGEIGQIKPSGWHTVNYHELVDGNYLYNRCHLIAFQLAGENANEKNLITGTRYLNVQGMLPFENDIAEYVRETGNHVLYRVTPVFEGENFVASGVLMEAWSVEDDGKGICINVYCYNVQPGIMIDYSSGESFAAESAGNYAQTSLAGVDYVLNTNTMKFHLPECSSVNDMAEKNKKNFSGDRDDLLIKGYSPCGKCKP